MEVQQSQPTTTHSPDRRSAPRGIWQRYYFDRVEAERAVRFIETQVIHIEGAYAGQPFILERWQRLKIKKFFGWKRRDNCTRRYRKLFVFLPRKNGKTALAAAIALYLQFADREAAAQVVCAAADKDQARIVFNMASEAVKANPLLRAMSTVYRTSIFCPGTNSVFKVLSKKPNTKHGANTHGAIIDEVHAIEDRELVDVITTGTIARRQPVTVFLSTAGHDKTHFFYALYEYAKSVERDPSIDESWLSVIYEADPEKWKDPEEWRRANPNFGVTMNMESFEEDFRQACEIPAYENTFKRLRLNIWTEQDSRLIPMDRWAQCFFPEWSGEGLEKQPCYAGLDLASTTDLAAYVLAFPPRPDRDFFDIKAHFWFPEGNLGIRRRRLGATDVEPWARAGFIELTEGEVIDYDRIRARLNADSEIYNIKEVAIDRWNATQLATQLDGDGFTVVPTGMGFATLSDPTKFLLGLILQRRLNHRNHPVLSWCAANVGAEQDAAGNIKPSKKRSKEKIDGVMATVLALSRALVNTKADSVYKKRGVITIG